MLDQYTKVLKILLEDTKVKELHGNNNYGALVDFSLDANEHRFFLVDLKQKKIIWTGYTTHGQGSSTIHKALEFSNENNSHKSSLGIYKTLQPYQSDKVGYALRLEGLSPGKNDNAKARGIVIHTADYVSEYFIEKNAYPGRSWGCFVIDPFMLRKVVDMLKNGSIIVATNSVLYTS